MRTGPRLWHGGMLLVLLCATSCKQLDSTSTAVTRQEVSPSSKEGPAPQKGIATTRLDASIEEIARFELTEPIAFRSAGGEEIQTPRVMVLRVETDPSSFLVIGERRAYWFFDRAQVQLVGRTDDEVLLLVPDPGAALASSLLWRTEPLVSPPSPEDVRRHLAKIGKGEVPVARVGDGERVLVPTGEPRQLESTDALQREVAKAWKRK